MPRFSDYPQVTPQWQDEILIRDVSDSQTAKCTLEQVYELFGWTTSTTTSSSSSTTESTISTTSSSSSSSTTDTTTCSSTCTTNTTETTTTSTDTTTSTSHTSGTTATTDTTTTSTETTTSSTVTCDYNEMFADGEKWYLEFLNNMTYSFAAGAVSMTDGGAVGSCQLLYKWALLTTDFDVRIDVTGHDGGGVTGIFVLADGILSTTNRYMLKYYDSGGWKVSARARINGVNQAEQIVGTTCSKLRFTRSGTVFYTYYYDANAWHLIDSADFAGFANNLIGIRLRADGAGLGAGDTVTFDNMVWYGGCPDGTYFWSSTSTTSHTTTCSTLSTGSTQSTTSSTETTVSTLSTTSSTDTTVSTLSTTSSTESSTSTESTTCSTGSTQSTQSTSSTQTTTESTTTTQSSSSSSTQSCNFDERFGDLSRWAVQPPQSNVNYSAVADALQFIGTMAGSGQCQLVYKWQVNPGDFDLRVDMPVHDGGFITGLFELVNEGLNNSDLAQIAVWHVDPAGPWQVFGQNTINGAAQASNTDNAQTDSLRITRKGTVVSLYYWGPGWVLLVADDYGARANELKAIRLSATTSAGCTDRVHFDNLVFYGGCPLEYAYQWTCSSSTTTTDTTTQSSTCSTESTSSTASIWEPGQEDVTTTQTTTSTSTQSSSSTVSTTSIYHPD